MKTPEMGMQRWLRAASIFITMGLIAEIVSLLRLHPLAFVLFGFVSVPLLGVGILIYLVSLVFVGSQVSKEGEPGVARGTR